MLVLNCWRGLHLNYLTEFNDCHLACRFLSTFWLFFGALRLIEKSESPCFLQSSASLAFFCRHQFHFAFFAAVWVFCCMQISWRFHIIFFFNSVIFFHKYSVILPRWSRNFSFLRLSVFGESHILLFDCFFDPLDETGFSSLINPIAIRACDGMSTVERHLGAPGLFYSTFKTKALAPS